MTDPRPTMTAIEVQEAMGSMPLHGEVHAEDGLGGKHRVVGVTSTSEEPFIITVEVEPVLNLGGA